MTALRPSDSSCRMAANDNDDGFLGCDIAPPNRQAQRRGHRLIILFVLLAGVMALFFGLSESVQGIVAAFPDSASMLQAQAWGRFFDALGQVATVGVILIAAALIMRLVFRRRHT